MSRYKLVNKNGDVSYRKTKRELKILLKKRRSKGEKGWKLVKK